MKYTTALIKFENSPLWGYHIMVPEEIAASFLTDKQTRLICMLNGVEEFQCALMPKGKGAWFINVNKEIRTRLHIREGDSVEVSLRKDESRYGLPMPEELEALLEQDDEGNRLFHALTPGKQRTLLFIVGKPKTSDIRLKKAIVVIEHLKAQQGRIDFKQLNEDMKDANRI